MTKIRHLKKSIVSRDLISTGQTGQVPGPPMEWGPPNELRFEIKYITLLNFLECAVTFCSGPTNLAIIF